MLIEIRKNMIFEYFTGLTEYQTRIIQLINTDNLNNIYHCGIIMDMDHKIRLLMVQNKYFDKYGKNKFKSFLTSIENPEYCILYWLRKWSWIEKPNEDPTIKNIYKEYDLNDKEDRKRYNKEYYSNPENRKKRVRDVAKNRECSRLYYQKNKEKILEKNRLKKLNNPSST